MRQSAALILAWALRARGVAHCDESEECTRTCGRLCMRDWDSERADAIRPLVRGDDALTRAADEATRYVACQEEHWGQLDCEGTTDGGTGACEPAAKCLPLATSLAREYDDCLHQCAAQWEDENYGDLDSFCFGGCARSCGIHAMVDDDASRRQTSEECRRLCSLYQGCPALDERYVHDPIRDRVIVAPSRRPVSPPSAEALPEDRWNYYDTDERNDLMARVQDEASVEFTRLQDLLDIAAAEDESLWDEYDEYDEYDVAYDDYGEEYDVAYDEYGGDWLDEYDDVYDVGRDVGYDEYGEL